MPTSNAAPNNSTASQGDDASRFMAAGGQQSDASPAPAANGNNAGDDVSRFNAVGDHGQQQDAMDQEAVREANQPQPGFLQRAAQTSGVSGLWDSMMGALHNLTATAQAQQDFRDTLATRDQAVSQLKAGDIMGAAKTLIGHLAKHSVENAMPGVTGYVKAAAGMGESMGANSAAHIKAAANAPDTVSLLENAGEAVPIIGPAVAQTSRAAATDLANNNYRGLAGDVAGAVVQALVAAGALKFSGGGAAAEGAEGEAAEGTLPEVSRADVKAQVVKDAIRKSLGSKADADVVQEAYSRMAPQNIFDRLVSPTENELKLVKPKVAADLNVMNNRLNSMLSDSGAQVEGTAASVNQSLSNMLEDVKSGVGDSAEAEKAINAVRDRVVPKATDEPMDVTDVNDLKRAVGDQIKQFQPPEMLSSAAKVEQEAYRQAYFKLRDLVSDAVPESRDLNMRISRAFDLQDLLEKKFPQLETAEQAAASYKGVRNAGKLKLAGKAAVGLGLADEARRLGNSIEGGN